ncbi:glycosyltransferase [Campylobacter sp. MOP7]|uniref:glycosyltransferase n=1 Tax=Campylobacter canis TaxID=3378588 RepID=UPI00387E64CD
MKILHTLHWVQFAGTEKVCTDLCNEMSRKHDVYILSKSEIQKYLEQEKVTLIEFDFEKNRYNPIFLLQTAKILKKIKPDIIHCHNTKELEIMKYAQLFLDYKIPLVVTRHNAEFKKNNSYADIGVAVSTETMEYMNSKKNILITNGVATKTPHKIELGKNFNILAVGRLAKVKGFDLLLKALSKVNFDFNLIILGEGNEKNNLEKLAKDLNISNKVEFKGFQENVADYVYSTDLQVIASETEGLSISLIEAILYAKLLVASDISNHKDIIGKELVFRRDENTLAEKLNNVHENYDKFMEIFSQIKEKKEQFSITTMTQKYIQAYKSLLK